MAYIMAGPRYFRVLIEERKSKRKNARTIDTLLDLRVNIIEPQQHLTITQDRDGSLQIYIPGNEEHHEQ